MKKVIITMISVFIISVILGTGIKMTESNTGTIMNYISNSKENSNNEIINIGTSLDYPIAEDIQQMYNESELIVVGTYENYDSSWNMARNPEDITQEDPNSYTEGRLYNFNVGEVLKGETNNRIKINFRYQEKLNLKDTNGNKHIVTIKDPLFLEPELGKKYIVFLKKDEVFGNYYGAIEPFQIMVDKNHVLELKTNLKESEQNTKNRINIENQDTVFVINNELPKITDNITGNNFKDFKKRLQNIKKQAQQ